MKTSVRQHWGFCFFKCPYCFISKKCHLFIFPTMENIGIKKPPEGGPFIILAVNRL
ncbi:hypothetical protein AbauAttikon1_0097 [Acinetobacter phage Abau_Attikon1]